jgi:hypothetical protein
MTFKNGYLTRTIYKLLEGNAGMRNDCLLVVQAIHDEEMKTQGYEKTNYYFLLFSEKVSNINTINRIWRLVQERCPNLRGTDWDERQKNAGLVKSEMLENDLIARQLKLF